MEVQIPGIGRLPSLPTIETTSRLRTNTPLGLSSSLQPHLARSFEEYKKKLHHPHHHQHGGGPASTGGGRGEGGRGNAPSPCPTPIFSSSVSSSSISSSASTASFSSSSSSSSLSSSASSSSSTPPSPPMFGREASSGGPMKVVLRAPSSHTTNEPNSLGGSAAAGGGGGGYLFLKRLHPEQCKPHVSLMLAQSINTSTSSSSSSSLVVVKAIKQSWLKSISKVPGHPIGELEALSILSKAPEHPHVVPLIEAMVDDECQYLVTPYVDGGELFDLVAQSPKGLPPYESCRYLVQIISGLLHLKRHGLSHGDVSLENVMISKGRYGASAPICRLIDLEMARRSSGSSTVQPTIKMPSSPLPPRHHRHTHQQRVILGGKSSYIDPQCLDLGQGGGEGGDEREIDWHAVDVWSLGVSLYTLLTGRHLYDNPDDYSFDILLAGRASELIACYATTYGLHVPPMAADLICIMLQPRASDRPTLEVILEHPWIKSVTQHQYHHHSQQQQGGRGGSLLNNCVHNAGGGGMRKKEVCYYNPLQHLQQPASSSAYQHQQYPAGGGISSSLAVQQQQQQEQQQVPQSLLDLLVQRAMREEEEGKGQQQQEGGEGRMSTTSVNNDNSTTCRLTSVAEVGGGEEGGNEGVSPLLRWQQQQHEAAAKKSMMIRGDGGSMVLPPPAPTSGSVWIQRQ